MMEFEDLLKYRIEAKANEIQGNAEMLRGDMDKLVRNIRNGYFGKVNGLGEVQKQGVEIDRQCAELRLMLSTLSEFVTWHESKMLDYKEESIRKEY